MILRFFSSSLAVKGLENLGVCSILSLIVIGISSRLGVVGGYISATKIKKLLVFIGELYLCTKVALIKSIFKVIYTHLPQIKRGEIRSKIMMKL